MYNFFLFKKENVKYQAVYFVWEWSQDFMKEIPEFNIGHLNQCDEAFVGVLSKPALVLVQLKQNAEYSRLNDS